MATHTTTITTRALTGAIALLSPLLVPIHAHAQNAKDADVAALRAQIAELDQKLRVLERKNEIKDEEAAAKAPTTPKVTASDKGFSIASPDGAYTFKLRGLLQADSRWFLNDGGQTSNDAFVLRRARPILEGTVGLAEFLFVPEFGGSTTSIQDASVNFVFDKSLQLKAGKFKSPVGLEQLQSDASAFFIERSIVTNLVPNRDLGVQLGGDLFDERVSYAVGVFNGLADGGNSTNADFDDEKSVAARVFVQPFRNSPDSVLQGLGFGLAGSFGNQESRSGLTGGYRSDGQQNFFVYRPVNTAAGAANSNIIADGDSVRVSPQAYYYNGSFGLLAEYVQSSTDVRDAGTGANANRRATIDSRGWQIAAGYVLTGEDSTFKGVTPAQPFNWANGTWGAFEVVARVARVDIDDKAFPIFANRATSASSAKTVGGGINWYLSRNLRITADYAHTEFDGTTSAILKNGEDAILTRFQVAF